MVANDQEKKRIGRYELRDEIGRGGMAVVYRAVDTTLGREVALKLLHPHLASHAEARTRFEREAQAVARLHHQSIIDIYDYSGEELEDVFLVMELIEGTNLRRFLAARQDRPLPAEGAALIARQIFAALAVAHQHSVIHRDVKPENILIGVDGTIKLSDFGIAHLAGVDQMTITGQILGSPAYMSPEHIEKVELDARADIFSVGIILYEMAVGAPPFHGTNPHQIIKRIVEGYYDHPLSVNPAVGHDIASVIVRCMQAEPERRYETADAAGHDLEAALKRMGIEAPDAELNPVLRDPDRWEADQRQTIISRTLDLGRTARRRRRLPEAMDHFNRVLSLEPGNTKALDAVAGLSRRRQLRRVIERLAVIMAALVAIGAVAWPLLNDEDRGRQPLPFSDLPGDAGPANADAAPTPEKPRPDAGTSKLDAGKRPKLPKLTLRPDYVRPARVNREVVFNSLPPAVSIKIDSGDPFEFNTTNRKRTLKGGTHSITYIPKDPRLQNGTWKLKIDDRSPDPIKFNKRLRWKPAQLLIKSSIDGAVKVKGRVPGKTNRPIKVPLKNTPSDGADERIRVLVAAEGYRPRTMEVTISAGETVEKAVTLVKLKDDPAAP